MLISVGKKQKTCFLLSYNNHTHKKQTMSTLWLKDYQISTA